MRKRAFIVGELYYYVCKFRNSLWDYEWISTQQLRFYSIFLIHTGTILFWYMHVCLISWLNLYLLYIPAVSGSKRKAKSFRDDEFFISSIPTNQVGSYPFVLSNVLMFTYPPQIPTPKINSIPFWITFFSWFWNFDNYALCVASILILVG